MATTKLLYSPQNFPYMGILEQLTRELQRRDAGPVVAYARFVQLRRQAKLHSSADYCSTAITSGGHAHRPDLANQEIIRKNTQNAQQLVQELAHKGCLNPRSTILPVDLGYIPTWAQSDYITFWLAVIAGFDLGWEPTQAIINSFARSLQIRLNAEAVNLQLMNDRTISLERRAVEYFKFARAFAGLAADYRPEPHSAHRVINLIDTRTSVGAQTERLFAHLHTIPVYDVKITGPARNSRQAFGDVSLYKDLELIFSYGATTVDLSTEDGFMLQQRPQAAWLQPANL